MSRDEQHRRGHRPGLFPRGLDDRTDAPGERRRHHPGGGPWGWDDAPGGRGRRGGPPPWMAGLFGSGERGRGPRVRRGDVRHAILDVLREAEGQEQEVNGYQVIQRIAERSQDQWRPSPGSVYPTIAQLEDEGLLTGDTGSGRRSLALTDEGRAYVAEHAEELDAVWTPFLEADAREKDDGLKPEIGRLMSAIWQIKATGTPAQQAAALEVLVESRRRLYGVLADADLD